MDRPARRRTAARQGQSIIAIAGAKCYVPIMQIRENQRQSHLPVTLLREPTRVISVRTTLILLAGAMLCASSTLALAQRGARAPAKPDARHTASNEPTLLGQYGSWGAYTASPNGKKLCFALAKPSSSKTNPPNRPRDPAYAFISTRPAEKVVNEVSIMIGYPAKPGSESTLEVGGGSYAMYVQGDGLWIKNAAEEEKLVEALRKSGEAVVKAVSSKGTQTTDVFSLKGLSQALDRVAQDCRR